MNERWKSIAPRPVSSATEEAGTGQGQQSPKKTSLRDDSFA
jgi:hypothetical protein